MHCRTMLLMFFFGGVLLANWRKFVSQLGSKFFPVGQQSALVWRINQKKSRCSVMSLDFIY